MKKSILSVALGALMLSGLAQANPAGIAVATTAGAGTTVVSFIAFCMHGDFQVNNTPLCKLIQPTSVVASYVVMPFTYVSNATGETFNASAGHKRAEMALVQDDLTAYLADDGAAPSELLANVLEASQRSYQANTGVSADPRDLARALLASLN